MRYSDIGDVIVGFGMGESLGFLFCVVRDCRLSIEMMEVKGLNLGFLR